MDKINELKELKELIENLKQEKLDNEKSIEEIKKEENSIKKIDKDIKGLKVSKFDIRMSIATNIAAVIILIFYIALFVNSISLGKIEIAAIDIGKSIFGLIFGVAFFYCVAYMFKYNVIKEYGCSSIKEINQKLEEKEQQKKLIKSKSETNKEIIREKEEKNSEIDIKLKKCVTELSKYEEVQNGLVNKYLNSPEFIQAMNSQMSMLLDEEKELDEKGNAYQKRK